MRAGEDISAGEFIIEYVGELITKEEFQRRSKIRKEKYRDYYYMQITSGFI